MRSTSTLILLSALAPLATAVSQAGTQAGPGDEAAARLSERAERPAEPVAPSYAGGGSGVQLFQLVGADNGECIRSIPDVNGDGLDEVVLGVGISGQDNVFCLDGASSGAASVVWSLQTSDGVSGGSCYGDQSIVPTSDAEGSGDANLLVGTGWGGRTAYDLDSLAGGTVWKFDTYLDVDSGWVYSLCEIGDVSGDGVPEYAFGTGSDANAVYLVDGASPGPQATVRWKYPAGDAVYSVRNLGDVNGDGGDDVLAAIGDDIDRIVCLDGDSLLPSGQTVWTHTPGVSVFACGVLSDVTGDGIDEALAVLWTLGGGAIRCLNGTSGAIVWTSTAVPDYGMMVDELEDVTGDGKPEVIVSSWENAVIVLDGDDGSLVWKTTVGTTNGGDVWTARAIDDLNGDGRQDVVAGSFDYRVYALDGDSGQVLWSFLTGNRVFSVYPVGDLNGDGRPEVAASMQDTNSSVVARVLEGDADLPFPAIDFEGFAAIGGPYGIEITGPASTFALPLWSLSTSNIFLPAFGILGLGLPVGTLPGGLVPPGGAFHLAGALPNDLSLLGVTLYWQGLLIDDLSPLSGQFTENVDSVTLH